ncbi:pyruvate synthase subunit beta, partial [Candidatus Bathyarchaeota archaeon]|nr:pyruvate synthase subunit beta [Candidatus Bathyarchaeota archaeon]
PLYEVENGKLKFTYEPKERIPIKEYTSLQRRFRHLDDSEIDKLQEQIEERWTSLVSKSQAKI